MCCILCLSMLSVVLLSSVPYWAIVLDNVIDDSFLTLRMCKSAFKINGSLMCANCRAWIDMSLLLYNWRRMHITLALSFALPSLFWWAWNSINPVRPTMCSWKLLGYCCYWWLCEFLTCFNISLIQNLLLILFVIVLLFAHEIFCCPSVTGKVIQGCKSFRSSDEWHIFLSRVVVRI